MVSDLVRVTIDKRSPIFTVEHGTETPPGGLTKEEKKEKKELLKELQSYEDFTTAEKADDDKRRQQTEKKKRLEQLKQYEVEPRIQWVDVSDKVLTIALLSSSSDSLPVYFENAPQTLLENMLKRPEIIININNGANKPIIAPGQTEEEVEPTPDTPQGKITWILEHHNLETDKGEPFTWKNFGCNLFTENPVPDRPLEEGWIILTTGWLGSSWGKVRDAFDAELGKENVIWVSANKESHWRLRL